MTKTVLNPKLYDSLKKRFGTVIIHNQGDKARVVSNTKAKRIGIMAKYVKTKPQLSAGEYYAVDCPYCNDTKARLWVNYLWGETIEGSVMRHICICYNEGCDLGKLPDELKPYLNRNKTRTAPVPIATKEEYEQDKEVEFPDGCVSLLTLPKNHVAIKYLKGRYFAARECDQFNVVYCESSTSQYAAFLDNRLVFPFYNDGKLIGYQTRIIDSSTYSKYWLCKGSKKTHTFFGIGIFDDIEEIYLCEGVFDAIRFGKGGLAVFGKTISQYQIDLLKKFYPTTRIFITLDADATNNAYKMKNSMEASGCRNQITVVPMLEGDPGSTALWELQNRIDQFR